MGLSTRIAPRSRGKLGRSSLKTVIVHAVPLLIAMITVLPFAYVAIISVQHVFYLAGDPRLWLSHALTLDTYGHMLFDTMMGKWMLNSLIVAGSVTILGLAIYTGAGYVFFLNRSHRLVNVLFGFVMIGIMTPRMVTIIPVFMMFRDVSLLNTYPALILPPLAIPVGVFLVRQALFAFPMELVDAARVDGASELRAFRLVVVPLLAPSLVVVGIYTFMEQWREFMWPLISTSVTSMMTLPVGLSTFQSEFRTDWGLFMAGVAIAIIPGAAVFLLFQRWFLRGLTAGALRG